MVVKQLEAACVVQPAPQIYLRVKNSGRRMAAYTGEAPAKVKAMADQRLARIENPLNRQAFTEYVTKRRAAALVDPGTHVADADEFLRFSKWLGDRSLHGLTPTDIITFFGTQTDNQPSTRYKSYVVLKRFFRELHGLDDGEVPPEFKGFKMKRPPKVTVLAEQLLDADELRRMLRACRNSMERVLIALLYEVGPRATELLSIDIMHVTKDVYGYLITIPDIDGNKTGGRRVRVHLAAPYLDQWLKDHNRTDELRAPLFYARSNRSRNKRYGYQSLLHLVKRVKADAGITKDVWPHLFRHTAATENVKRGLVGPPLARQMGWVIGTDQESVYVHLSDADNDNLVLASYGIQKAPGATSNGLLPVACPQCKANNAATAVYCDGCAGPLTQDAQKVAAHRKTELLQAMLAERLAAAYPVPTSWQPGPTDPVHANRLIAWHMATHCRSQSHSHDLEDGLTSCLLAAQKPTVPSDASHQTNRGSVLA